MRSVATLSHFRLAGNIGAAIVSVGTRTAGDGSSAVACRAGRGGPELFAQDRNSRPLQVLDKLRNPSRESLGGEALRKVSLVVAALAAMLCLTAVAVVATNQYSVTGKIASGGSKKKPKEVGVQFNYQIKTDDGTLSNPVKTYKIHFQGLKSNPAAVAGGKYCTAASINKASSDSGCSSKTHVGTGLVK